MLKNINNEYKAEGKNWSAHDERLEIRLDLAKHIEEILFEEISKELERFS